MTEEIKTEISTDCSYYKDVVKNEIIVDGVNVAGCKNYVHIEEERYKPECNCRLTTVERGYYCDTYATSVCEEEDCDYKQLKRLEQENKELKERIENWKNLKPIDIKEFCQTTEKIFDNNNNYRSALEEIRILATKNVSIENFVKIQNKINEVLN